MYDCLLIFSTFSALLEIHEWTQNVVLIMLFLMDCSANLGADFSVECSGLDCILPVLLTNVRYILEQVLFLR
jgi:hypothetical protein